MNKYIKIDVYKFPHVKKCECCDRVKDIFYKINLYSVEDDPNKLDMIVGNLSMCKQCGDNFNKIIGNELAPNEKVLKTFKF